MLAVLKLSVCSREAGSTATHTTAQQGLPVLLQKRLWLHPKCRDCSQREKISWGPGQSGHLRWQIPLHTAHCLSCELEVPISELDMVVHTCNPNTWEAEAEGLRVQGQPGLHSEFKACLGYMVRPCLQRKWEKEKERNAHFSALPTSPQPHSENEARMGFFQSFPWEG
jgi:hypothetical protein